MEHPTLYRSVYSLFTRSYCSTPALYVLSVLYVFYITTSTERFPHISFRSVCMLFSCWYTEVYYLFTATSIPYRSIIPLTHCSTGIHSATSGMYVNSSNYIHLLCHSAHCPLNAPHHRRVPLTASRTPNEPHTPFERLETALLEITGGESNEPPLPARWMRQSNSAYISNSTLTILFPYTETHF